MYANRKARPVENRDVKLLQAIGDMLAKQNGTYGVMFKDEPEAEAEIWYGKDEEPEDPFMEEKIWSLEQQEQ